MPDACYLQKFLCGKAVPPQNSLASREKRSKCENVALVVIHDTPSVMADLIDRTLVKDPRRGCFSVCFVEYSNKILYTMFFSAEAILLIFPVCIL